MHRKRHISAIILTPDGLAIAISKPAPRQDTPVVGLIAVRNVAILAALVPALVFGRAACGDYYGVGVGVVYKGVVS